MCRIESARNWLVSDLSCRESHVAKLLLPFGNSPTASRVFSPCTSWFPLTAYLSSWKSRVRFDVLPYLGPQVIAAAQVACRHNSRVFVRRRSPKDQ